MPKYPYYAYPTAEEVEAADQKQLASWWRFLPGPGANRVGKPDFEYICGVERVILDKIGERLAAAGGFTPEISKQIDLVRLRAMDDARAIEHTKPRQEAYFAGLRARRDGLRESENPYPRSGVLAPCWIRGWNEANDRS